MQIEKSLLYQRIFFTAFWIRGTFSFISEEVFLFLDPLSPIVFLAYDFVICLLGILTIRKRCDITILCGFIAISYFSTCVINGLSLLFYINGLRDFLSFLFLIPIFRYFFEEDARKKRFVESFDKQLIIFLVIQALCLVWQFFKYGAGDHGGGSLGNWNSGIISTMIYLSSFYLMQKKIGDDYFKGLSNNIIYIILLFPTFLNETKISFILFAAYFLLLISINRKAFFRILIIFPLIIVLMFGAISVYMMSSDNTNDIFTKEYYTEMYLMNDDSEEYAKWLLEEDMGDLEDIPRFSKLLILGEIFEENPNNIFTGFGLGHFKGGTFIDFSDFFKEYEWTMIGSIPYLFHIIIQLGLTGILFFIVFWGYYMGFKEKEKFRNLNLQLYIILVVFLILFYNDSLRSSFMSVILMYMLFSSNNMNLRR